FLVSVAKWPLGPRATLPSHARGSWSLRLLPRKGGTPVRFVVASNALARGVTEIHEPAVHRCILPVVGFARLVVEAIDRLHEPHRIDGCTLPERFGHRVDPVVTQRRGYKALPARDVAKRLLSVQGADALRVRVR